MRSAAGLAQLVPLAHSTIALSCRSEEHTSELQSHRDLHSFPTRRSSDLMTCERLLMRIDEGHAIGRRIGTARSAGAQHDRLELRQEARAGEILDLAQPLAVELDRRMPVEPRMPAGAR